MSLRDKSEALRRFALPSWQSGKFKQCLTLKNGFAVLLDCFEFFQNSRNDRLNKICPLLSLRAFAESEAIYEFKIPCGKFAKMLTLNFKVVDCLGDCVASQ